MKIAASLYDSITEAIPHIYRVIGEEQGMAAEITRFALSQTVKKQFCVAKVIVKDTKTGFHIIRHEFWIINRDGYEPFIRTISTTAIGRKVVEFPMMKLLAGELVMEFVGVLHQLCHLRMIMALFDYRNGFSDN